MNAYSGHDLSEVILTERRRTLEMARKKIARLHAKRRMNTSDIIPVTLGFRNPGLFNRKIVPDGTIPVVKVMPGWLHSEGNFDLYGITEHGDLLRSFIRHPFGPDGLALVRSVNDLTHDEVDTFCTFLATVVREQTKIHHVRLEQLLAEHPSVEHALITSARN